MPLPMKIAVSCIMLMAGKNTYQEETEMAEKILIPLDGSRSSETVLKQVTKLIDDIKPRTKTELVLFEVVKPPVRYIPV